MLTQMYVGGVMACTHDQAPAGQRIAPMFPSAVHKCTVQLGTLEVSRPERFAGRERQPRLMREPQVALREQAAELMRIDEGEIVGQRCHRREPRWRHGRVLLRR